jgi:hypothetical protein
MSTPAFYTIGKQVLSLGAKWQGQETAYSPPSNPEVKNGGAIPPLPHVFHGIMHSDNFIFNIHLGIH